MEILGLVIEPSWLFLAGCALLTMLLMRRTSRYFGQRISRSGSGPHLEHLPRPVKAWDGAQRDAFALIERQKVELHEISRDLTGQIDSKMILLEQLIATSNQQIERMEGLVAQLQGARRS